MPGSEGAAAGGGVFGRGGYSGFVHLQVPQPLRRGEFALKLPWHVDPLILGILSRVQRRAVMFSRALSSWHLLVLDFRSSRYLPAPLFLSTVEVCVVCPVEGYTSRVACLTSLRAPFANPTLLPTRHGSPYRRLALPPGSSWGCRSNIFPASPSTPAAATTRRPLEDYVVEDPGRGRGEAYQLFCCVCAYFDVLLFCDEAVFFRRTAGVPATANFGPIHLGDCFFLRLSLSQRPATFLPMVAMLWRNVLPRLRLPRRVFYLHP